MASIYKIHSLSILKCVCVCVITEESEVLILTSCK